MREQDKETTLRITGPCSCSEGFTSRKLIDPACVYHECHQEIEEALTAARAEGMERAAKIAPMTDPIDEFALSDEEYEAFAEARERSVNAIRAEIKRLARAGGKNE